MESYSLKNYTFGKLALGKIPWEVVAWEQAFGKVLTIFVYNQTGSKDVLVTLKFKSVFVDQGEEDQPHQSLVRATFSSFSRPSHLEILVLRLLCV